MPEQIYTAAELDALLEQHAQLVDVLGADEYAEDHIPGAVSIPLKQLNPASTAGLDCNRPVVVYCFDFA